MVWDPQSRERPNETDNCNKGWKLGSGYLPLKRKWPLTPWISVDLGPVACYTHQPRGICEGFYSHEKGERMIILQNQERFSMKE